jgi:hypothetical protein
MEPTKTTGDAGNYIFKPFAIPIDWLEINLDHPAGNRTTRPWGGDDTIPVGDRYVLQRQPGRTRTFDRIDHLVDRRNDRTVAVVRSVPNSAHIMPMNRVMVKLENSTLYDYTWADVLQYLRDIVGLKYQSTSRLDLAADGYDFLQPFGDAAKGAASYGGRADFVVRWSQGKVKAAELGTRAGNKFARIYGKSKELRLSGKLYIADYWNRQGEEHSDDVERCEISTKGKEVRRYFEDERRPEFIDYLTCPRYRARVYDSLAATFIRFRSGSCGDRSRDREDLLSWDWSAITSNEPIERNARQRRVQDIGLNALKAHVRLAYMIHVATDSQRHLSCAQEVAEACGMGTWMRNKAPMWKRQAAMLSAEGFRASTLFDLLQDCDAVYDENLRAQVMGYNLPKNPAVT